jgi:hypothetical protein
VKQHGGWHLARVPLLLAVTLTVAACTGEGSGQDSRRGVEPALELTGRILATGGFRDPHVYIHDLAADTTERILLPGGDGNVLGAFWSESGDAAYVLVDSDGTGRFLEIAPGGEVRPLGETVLDATTADYAGSQLLTTACGGKKRSVLVMDVAGGNWKKVAPGCSGALSPDGQEVVYSPDGRELWMVPSSGGAERKLADVSETLGLEPREAGRARVHEIEWGEGGVALEVVLEDHTIPALLGEDGKLVPAPEDPGADQLDLEWQPGGGELAIATFSSAFTDAEAIIRMFGADTGDGKVVAVDPSRFFNMTWSPDGDFLVATTSRGRWVFIDGEGNWLMNEHIIPASTLDWAR